MAGRIHNQNYNAIDMDKIRISSQSIKTEVSKYKKDIPAAIAEYIWNAFDSNAQTVRIECKFDNQLSAGYPTLEISDDGDGWDMSNINTVEMFLDSQKRVHKTNYKSLPHGSRGVGRFSFAAFSSKAIWKSTTSSKVYDLEIDSTTLNKYTLHSTDNIKSDIHGTTVEFLVNNETINATFIDTILKAKTIERFAWFLELYPSKRIIIDNVPLDTQDMIAEKKETVVPVDGDNLPIKLIQWKKQLLGKEASRIYFLSADKEEQFKVSTGFNNKSDVFHHSAYIESDRFIGYIPENNPNDDNQQSLPIDKEQRDYIKEAKEKVQEELREFRTPYIEKISHDFVKQLSEEHIMPSQRDYAIPEEDFKELVRQTYVIAPEMYTNLSDNNKRVTLGLMASLMTSNERNLLIKTIEGVYSLSEEQKKKLNDLLDRTTLGNIVDTVSEIDHRLQTLADLEDIIYDKDKASSTLEVKHLQKILDNEFWVFGEQYRLVTTTEGQIKEAIERLAKDDLDIPDYSVESSSKKELDLCLAKQIVTPQPDGMSKIHNIVVELKRPSVKIGKKELDQILTYKDHLLEEPICKSQNMSWDFILVGSDIGSSDINEQINSAATHGEKSRGLIRNNYEDDKHYKIYVRRWSDIINCEHRPRLEFLRSKLNISPLDNTDKTQDEIAKSHAGQSTTLK